MKKTYDIYNNKKIKQLVKHFIDMPMTEGNFELLKKLVLDDFEGYVEWSDGKPYTNY